jgi:hypothetical protein
VGDGEQSVTPYTFVALPDGRRQLHASGRLAVRD